jgi:hypothetical protein
MKTAFHSIVDSLYHLFAGEQEEEISFKEKRRVVVGWLFVLAFCVVMMKLLL